MVEPRASHFGEAPRGRGVATFVTLSNGNAVAEIMARAAFNIAAPVAARHSRPSLNTALLDQIPARSRASRAVRRSA